MAAARGHVLENDPPHGLSRMRRQTCTKCGSAVLLRPDGSGYGSALESDCDNHLVECAAQEESDMRIEAV
jgi:hypothetical protein